ncbi:MAG: class I tRNA ligase family protein, partial [Candidatus Thorarchaeota archaeon]
MTKKFEPAIKSKRWKPPAEEEILEQWKENWVYKFNPDSGKELYSVDTPPPYLSGYTHLGQLIHYTQIDMIARFRSMQGKEVNFPLGI